MFDSFMVEALKYKGRDFRRLGPRWKQKEAGDQHREGPIIRATSAKQALEIAQRELPGADEHHNIWTIPCDEIIATGKDEVIWRHTDQTYRLARGYSKTVREKWEQIREEKALREYEKLDLTEAF